MASIKAQKALAPKLMRVDGNAAVECDKVVLGASPGLGTPALNDTLDYLVPAGALVHAIKLVFDDCDTGSTYQASVGYRPVNPASLLAPSTTYFRAASAFAQAAGTQQLDFKPIKFEEDVYVQIVTTAAPAGISGNPEVHAIVEYRQEGPK